MSNSSTGEPRREEDELKQDLDEELSQIVHDYESKGLPPSEIVDSVLWHAEVAAARSPDDTTVSRYTSS